MNAGIFGPKLSGKTTLARELCAAWWRREGKLTLALDPHLDGGWGKNVWATADEVRFWRAVSATKNHILIIDEAAVTIARNRKLVGVFTALRHRGHWVYVIGHSGSDLLPVMRQNLDEIFLFRQPQSAAEVWAEVFTEPRLLECVNLKQFEFIHHKMFGTPIKNRLKL